MYTVTFNNSGGELESRKAVSPEMVAKEVISIIENVGALYAGDHITVVGEEGDE